MMNRVIFLVGGPGSGKDVILKDISARYNLMEFTLEQVNHTFFNKISNSDKRVCILNRESFVISTNAYDYEKIKQTKNLLENFGYHTAMVYVDVDYDVSKGRMIHRENFSEDSWKDKITKCKQNISNFNSIFEHFIKMDNSFSLNMDPLHLFCELFIHDIEANLFESSEIDSKLLNKHSIKKKLIKSKRSTSADRFITDPTSKFQTDRIGDEYSVRNSAIGYPSTIGPFYSETFADVADLPAFSSLDRGVPPPETLSDPKSIQQAENKNKVIKKIKNIAILSWKGK